MNEPSQPNETPDSEQQVDAADVIAASAEDLENLNPDSPVVGDDSADGEVDELTQLKQKLEEAEKEALRVQADMENFRKRTRRDTTEQIRYATMPLVTELVDVIDNLQRAIDAAEANQSGDGLLEGVKMVSQHLVGVLSQQGCQPIDSVGQPFDPNFHEAVQMQPSDEFEANTVSMETRKGYRLHERVVRPAQVFVSTGPKSED